ncbi:MAG: DUF4890 domain-containing protein [Flavobacteriales bacterium]|jgi:Spy/CpxP family protein refolding chaperone|nr:DUF4890 domain-containing protein [Flavobacteriales bacterium]MCB0759050.1 DUF4890 domain-containing protein [Flavobacteriales bacterium]
MRTILITLALAMGLGAFAQNADNTKKTPAEKAERRTERMVTELDLDATQKDKVSKINLDYANAMKDVNSLTDKTAREKRGEVIKANRDNALKAVLTTEQFNKMNALHAERKAQHDAEKKATKE